MPLVTIDDQPLEAEQGTLVIQAADRLAIEVPRFCYHPDLRPEGNCRMCLVEVKGFPRLTVACCTPIADGMIVRTANTSPLVQEAVRGVLEFLLLNHPIDCPICDQAGECSLQDFYLHPEWGLHRSSVDPPEKVRKRKAIPLGPLVEMDSERCVLCSRCVRFSEEVSGAAELQFVNRGNHVEITAFEDRALADPYAGNLVDVCPVGALTSRPFRFKCRVWHLRHADSVCAGCSTGCNVRIDSANGAIQRLLPRRNPEVNQSWLCDEGRMSFQALDAAPRLLTPRIGQGAEQRPADWQEAVIVAHAGLRDAAPTSDVGTLAALASTSATNETLLLFRRYATCVAARTRLDCRLDHEDLLVNDRQDHLLRRRDKHPNSRGAIALGLAEQVGGGLGAMVAEAEAGAVDRALVLYIPPLVGTEGREALDLLGRLLRAVSFGVVLTTHEAEWLSEASVALPIAAWSEEEGTYTNYAGIPQQVTRALEPCGQARSAATVLAQLLGEAGRPVSVATPARLFAEVVAQVPQYGSVAYDVLVSRQATVYPPEGRFAYGQGGFAGH